MQSEYISYLNSLHNVDASNTNALAESQALQSYFAEIYEAFSITEPLYNKLINTEDSVIILTGHAGDGKSTIALDIFKRLRGIPSKSILDKPLSNKEVCSLSNERSLNIVKDMSELKSEEQQEWLKQGFSEPGSWLIVSNTGPLLTSLRKYILDESDIENASSIENKLLLALDKTYQDDSFESITIQKLDDYSLAKPLIIINVARLDNTKLGAELLQKMLGHSGWNECTPCPSINECPIRKNRQALLESKNIVEKVHWVYQRLTAYEQRLTLRHMIGHLAVSLTGNMNCQQINSHASTQNYKNTLGKILFSETFFGYRLGKKNETVAGVKAAELLQKMELGGNIAADFERQLIRDTTQRCFSIPTVLKNLEESWLKKAKLSQDGIHLRHSLRRMAYIFGNTHLENHLEKKFDTFLNIFLQSSNLRNLDNWNNGGWEKLGYSGRSKVLKKILSVLLEVYSGFKGSQFSGQDILYFTMRRNNSDVFQASQLIIASQPFEEFKIELDRKLRIPTLIFKKDPSISLSLNLPLLDFINDRSQGRIGTSLSPLHLANLEAFRSRLISFSDNDDDHDNISILKVGVKGEAKIKKYYYDRSEKILDGDL